MLEIKLSWKQVCEVIDEQYNYAEKKHKANPENQYWEGVYVSLQAVNRLIKQV